MKINRIYIVLCTLAILFTTNAYAQDVEKEVVLACETSFLTSSVWIAENKEYFKEEGINVKIKEFGSGRTALATMLNNGDIDICTVAQTPIMFNSFKRNDYVIIAAMVYADNDVKILARKDKGIKAPLDLNGRKVGLTKGSTGHYFLSLFSVINDIDYSELEIVDIEATDLTQALVDGRVDVISTWEPHIVNTKKLLGENAVEFSIEDIFREDFYFVVTKKYLKENQDAVRRFLKAIDRGDEFIRNNKEDAIAIVSKRLEIDKELTSLIWDTFNFQLILDQSIFTSLEDQARWAIREGFTDKKEIPNYLDFIYLDALKEIKPESVTIIH